MTSHITKTHKLLKVIHNYEMYGVHKSAKDGFLVHVWVGERQLSTLYVCLDYITKQSRRLCSQQDLLCLIQSQSCSHVRLSALYITCLVVFSGFPHHVFSQDPQEVFPGQTWSLLTFKESIAFCVLWKQRHKVCPNATYFLIVILKPRYL